MTTLMTTLCNWIAEDIESPTATEDYLGLLSDAVNRLEDNVPLTDEQTQYIEQRLGHSL